MLQPRKQTWILLFLLIMAVMILVPGCLPDASTQSEEEAAYLADYESPAEKWGYIDTTGKMIIPATFDDVAPFSEGYAPVNQNGKWGYIDRKAEMVIPPQFKSAWAFHEGKARVMPFDQPEHFITKTGKAIASVEWAAADDFSGGLAKVKVGSSYGYIDTGGTLVLPAIYSRGWNFHHQLAVIAYEEKLGIINYKGEEVIRPLFDQVKYLDREKLFLCSTLESSSVFDHTGKELARLENTKMVDSDGKMLSLRKGDQMFFFDLAILKLLPGPSWSGIIYLGENRWAGKNEFGYFLLDSNGKKLNRQGYAQINRFSHGLAAYYNGKSWGYIDLNGIELTADVFGLAWDYKEGFARAAFKEGIAFLDRNQRLAFYPPPGTLDMRDFSENLAPVQIAQ